MVCSKNCNLFWPAIMFLQLLRYNVDDNNAHKYGLRIQLHKLPDINTAVIRVYCHTSICGVAIATQ